MTPSARPAIKRAMITREIDWRSPLAAFAPLAGEPFAALFHPGGAARWSTIAAFPSTTLEARHGETFYDGGRTADAPFNALRRLLRERPERRAVSEALIEDSTLNFWAGLCGYIGYEMGGELEMSAAGPASPFALPDMALGAYDALVHFDRALSRAFITAYTEDAAERLEDALGRETAPAPDWPEFSVPVSNFTGGEYKRAVAEIIGLIRDGALFQANLSQQIAVEAAGAAPALALFEQIADAPFAAFLQYKDGAILSNSPERFFKIAGRRITAEPIKGTRRRAREGNEDRALAASLIADAKERAENIMIADLIRNDLSRVCRDHSIREEAICVLESVPYAHHLVSRISGELREGLNVVDALEALFPCGSVTGAPKIEAMKTIARMEKVGRGPYCGAIGYIDDSGEADFSVAIRLLILSAERRRVTFPVGGGVTLRSDPQEEYAETLLKARGPLETLRAARPR